jgi:hypothetical protein
MLELNVVVGGSPTTPCVRTFPDRFTVEYGLRLVHIDLADATAAPPIQLQWPWILKIVIGELDRVCGFVDSLLVRGTQMIYGL